MGDPFDVHVESVSVVNCTSFVHGFIHISDHDRRDEFFGGELVFPDELSVNTRGIGTRIYQCGRVDNFQHVQEGDQLYWDSHRFV